MPARSTIAKSFAAAQAQGGDVVQALRQTLRRLEQAGLETEAAPLAFGIPELDVVLGGGLVRGTLHELAAPRESAVAAPTGFAFALAAMLPARTHLVWIGEDMALLESGALHGPGLDALGLSPERLVMVAVPKAREVLWAMEEALRCRAVGAVIAELRAEAVDLVTSRRLSLAAAGSGALGFLLRTEPRDEASTAATRWIVGAAPSAAAPVHGPGPPRFAAALVRNRRGPLGSWVLEYSRDQRFVLAAYPQPVAEPALHRPRAAGVA
jgi:protein ImuA